MEKCNIFTKGDNKISLTPNDYKKMELIDSKETFANGTSKSLVPKKMKKM